MKVASMAFSHIADAAGNAIRQREGLQDFVYIAGRYGDGSDFVLIEERINRARAHAAQLARAGIPFFAPFLNAAHFDRITPEVPLDFWHKQDAAFLPRAWGLYVIEHEASESVGTQREMRAAMEAGKPVFLTSQFDVLVAHWKEAHDD